jgi:hypothetical protein
MVLFLHLSKVKVPSSAFHAQTSPILTLRHQVSGPYKTVILNKIKQTVIELPLSNPQLRAIKLLNDIHVKL